MRIGRAAAIVLAGGSGTRVGGERNKVYLPLAGRSVIAWSLITFRAMREVGPVVLVVRAADRDLADRVVAEELEPAGVESAGVEPGGVESGGVESGGVESGGVGPAGVELPGVEIVTGGASRQESELAGLRHLASRIGDGSLDTVLIHDGARPLMSRALAVAVLEAATPGGAVPGLPRDDLAVAAPDGTTLHGPGPDGVVAVQTPQGFRAAPLLAAYEEAARRGFAGTDTASCMQRFAPELPIRAIPGDERNFKITFAHDLLTAEAVLARAGHHLH